MTGKPSVTIRELANDASRVIRDVADSGEPKLVTRHGRPVAAIVPFDDRQLAALLQEALPDLTASLDGAIEERNALQARR